METKRSKSGLLHLGLAEHPLQAAIPSGPEQNVGGLLPQLLLTVVLAAWAFFLLKNLWKSRDISHLLLFSDFFLENILGFGCF